MNNTTDIWLKGPRPGWLSPTLFCLSSTVLLLGVIGSLAQVVLRPPGRRELPAENRARTERDKTVPELERVLRRLEQEVSAASQEGNKEKVETFQREADEVRRKLENHRHLLAEAVQFPDWRRQRWPYVEQPPDASRIHIFPRAAGQAEIVGKPGAAGDPQARLVRIVNLRSADRVFVPVGIHGEFRARLFAPPGSWLQINSVGIPAEEMPPEARERLQNRGAIHHSQVSQEPAEPWIEFLTNHPSSSPGTITFVDDSRRRPGQWPGFVKRVGSDLRLFGQAQATQTLFQPGGSLQVTLDLNVVGSPDEDGQKGHPIPQVDFFAFSLFDQQGRQRPRQRLSVSHLLTPTGLPIETHGEMALRRGPGEEREWHHSFSGCPLRGIRLKSGPWRDRAGTAVITQQYSLFIPQDLPPGLYSLGANVWGVGQPHFGDEGPLGSPPAVGYFCVGRPSRPRLCSLLLGSAGSGGARGALAREDRAHYALNPRNVLMPEKLIVPRDDAFTGKTLVYPLDPYLPMLSLTDRPAPVIPAPGLPLDFTKSRLTVTVTTPQGQKEILGPAPLTGGQNDLGVLRPDLVLRDRVLPPVSPTYGNPSLAEIYHLTGRGAFNFTFREYGHHEIRLDGSIADLMGTNYSLSGTYDVYVAKPLDIDIFPEPGTPLEPERAFHPQVRVLPARAAEVEMVWHHYPGSDPKRVQERRILGRANRFGLFVPGNNVSPVRFDEPGEYRCDVTVRYQEPNGPLWMAARRGASVVRTPNSKVIVHGERGNRSATARWRARWFVAGDGRFMAPPDPMPGPQPSGRERANRRPPILGFGHTCYPYEPGDVAWLGDHDPFSLFPNLTFEDPEGKLADLLEKRWPGVRQGEGREGLYPHRLLPEDRRAIGELPYVCMTAGGLPPTLNPGDVDLWGYFYTTSWRPGLGVRSQVSEDLLPAGYWFFDDPYGYQFGNGPAGDLAGDVKMNYGGSVFRDARTGRVEYGAYASMLVLIPDSDRRGPRVLPPFDGLVPGSPPSGPLVEIGSKRYDVFLTFAAQGPGAILEVGDRLRVAGVLWPPIPGHVRGTISRPGGTKTTFKIPSNDMGLFDGASTLADEAGLWRVTAEGVCSGKTSVGTISELVPESRWPHGGGLGLAGTEYPVPVVPQGAPPLAFDIPVGSRAWPPRPLMIRGQVPPGRENQQAGVIVSLPGQVIDQGFLPIRNGYFEYVYDPRALKRRHPNLDVVIGSGDPDSPRNRAPAWFDTVVFTFWVGEGREIRAGTVLLQGEEVLTQVATGRPLPTDELTASVLSQPGGRPEQDPGSFQGDEEEGNSRKNNPFPASTISPPHSSLLVLSPRGDTLWAGHPWSGEVTRLAIGEDRLQVKAVGISGGELRSLALSPDGKTIYAVVADPGRVVAFEAATLRERARFEIPGRPWGVLCSADGTGLFVADFDRDRVYRLETSTGRLVKSSPAINRPSCLALSRDGKNLYAVSFRTGELVVLDEQCRLQRRLASPTQLNQCKTLTLSPDGLLFMPQTRSDTVLGGRVFDRSVFPAIAVARPGGDRVEIEHFLDLLVVPPHRPAEVVMDARTLYLASAGSDDVLALDRHTGFARWHAQKIGLEPGAIALDSARGRLLVLTLTGQEIVMLDSETGRVLSRIRTTHDPTPTQVARGRYLFGTATDKRLTKDHWMSCAVCHPEGGADGRQWDLGEGRLDTRPLGGCLQTPPLHYNGRQKTIQDTFLFTRLVMAGQWFDPPLRRLDERDQAKAESDKDLDALVAFIASLPFPQAPKPPFETAQLRRIGQQIFFNKKAGCVQCHPPPFYTDSGRRDPEGELLLHHVGTCSPGCSVKHSRLDTPSLLGLLRSEPYLHHGQARTLEEVFTRFNPQDQHGRTSHLGEGDIRALAEFLRYLKQGSP